jgi:hypothetical protein
LAREVASRLLDNITSKLIKSGFYVLLTAH